MVEWVDLAIRTAALSFLLWDASLTFKVQCKRLAQLLADWWHPVKTKLTGRLALDVAAALQAGGA